MNQNPLKVLFSYNLTELYSRPIDRKHTFSNTYIALRILADSGNRKEMYPGLSFESFKNLKKVVFSPQLSKVEKAAPEALPYHTLVTKVEK